MKVPDATRPGSIVFRPAPSMVLVEGLIRVSEGVLGLSGSHPCPLLSVSYGP